MFVGINVCIFDTKLISPGLMNFLDGWNMFAGIYLGGI